MNKIVGFTKKLCSRQQLDELAYDLSFEPNYDWPDEFFGDNGFNPVFKWCLIIYFTINQSISLIGLIATSKSANLMESYKSAIEMSS